MFRISRDTWTRNGRGIIPSRSKSPHNKKRSADKKPRAMNSASMEKTSVNKRDLSCHRLAEPQRAKSSDWNVGLDQDDYVKLDANPSNSDHRWASAHALPSILCLPSQPVSMDVDNSSPSACPFVPISKKSPLTSSTSPATNFRTLTPDRTRFLRSNSFGSCGSASSNVVMGTLSRQVSNASTVSSSWAEMKEYYDVGPANVTPSSTSTFRTSSECSPWPPLPNLQGSCNDGGAVHSNCRPKNPVGTSLLDAGDHGHFITRSKQSAFEFVKKV